MQANFIKVGIAGIQLSLLSVFLLFWAGPNSPLPLLAAMLAVTGTILVGAAVAA